MVVPEEEEEEEREGSGSLSVVILSRIVYRLRDFGGTYPSCFSVYFYFSLPKGMAN